MSDTQQLPLSVQPVISYPREAKVGKTYLMTIDLQPSEDNSEWLYEEEEYPIYCMVDSSPLFSSKPIGEPAVLLHRFGGSYGAAKFLLTAAQHKMEGEIRITLVNRWGVPVRVLNLPDIQIKQEVIPIPRSLGYLGHRDREQFEKRLSCFSWLHLTDLHLGMSEQDRSFSRIREVFFKDLARLHENCGPWDLVLFTGDITQSGSVEEFRIVDDFLNQLWEHFERLGSSPKLLAVPGNHDLVRPSQNSLHIRRLLEWDNLTRDVFWMDEGSVYRQVVTQAFANYTEWWERQPHRPEGINSGMLPGDFSYTYEKDGAQLGIVGLNTSFLQLTGNNYKGRLALDVCQFHGACNSNGPAWSRQHNACLLLTHHPPSWLTSRSRQQLQENIIANQFQVHLCGSLHEPAYQEIAAGGIETHRTWQGRSLFGLQYFEKEREVQRLDGYTIGRIELKENEGTLIFWPREARRQGSQRNLVPDYSFNLTDDRHTIPKNFELLLPYNTPLSPINELEYFAQATVESKISTDRYIDFGYAPEVFDFIGRSEELAALVNA